MPAHEPLTDAECRALKPSSTGRVYRADGRVPGLGLLVLPSGAKRWRLSCRLGSGRGATQLVLSLGAYPEVGLKEARQRASAARAEVAAGRNPREERDRRLETVAEAGEAWFAAIEPRRKPATVSAYRGYWRRVVLPTMGRQSVSAVTFGDIERLHRRIAKGAPYAANRCVAMLSAFFRWTIRHNLRADNPCQGIDRASEEVRERFLDVSALERIGAALRQAESVGLPPAPSRRSRPARGGAKAKHVPKSAAAPVPADPVGIAAIRFAMLTGWRVSEICALRWDAVRFEQSAAMLGDTKTGASFRPLGAPAMALLENLHARRLSTAFVFPSARRWLGGPRRNAPQLVTDEPPRVWSERLTDRPIGPPTRVWYAIRHAAGLENVRFHDLRHSFGSVAVGESGNLPALSSLLGHKRLATTQRYGVASRDVRHAVADAASNRMAAVAFGASSVEAKMARPEKLPAKRRA